MKALLTGAGGFCGKHLMSHLREQGLEVHTISCRDAATPHHHRIADVTDIEALTALMRSIRPDYVFHLAGISQSPDPTLFYKINTQYAVALLAALNESGFTRCPVLLVGTAAEYGKITAAQLPVREDLSPRPYSHYGISKLAQTLAGLAAWNDGQPVVVARPFNVIGPGMPEHISVQSFALQITSIIKGRIPPVVEVGNINTTRDFIDVRDVVRIYWQLVQTPAAYGEIVNICSGRGSHMKDIMAKLIELSGGRIEVRSIHSRLKPVDVPAHYGSAEKLLKILGSVPHTDIEKTLAHILEDLRNR